MKQIIILSVGILGFLILIFPLIILMLEDDNKHTILIKCYDRYSNEIIGLDCEDEVFDSELANILIELLPSLTLAAFMLIFGSAIFYVLNRI